jgi:cyclopropane fatty-acyl-phospholipid synthase-like methyltransferase
MPQDEPTNTPEWPSASTADKYELYQRSVQEPEADIDFIDRVFRREYGRPPVSVREDFCGTAYFSSEWVKSASDRTALGIDLDTEPLDWGRRNNLAPLGSGAARVTLLNADVMEVTEPKVDVVAVFNFSHCYIQQRSEMLRYFRTVKIALHQEGLLVLDVQGGPESLEKVKEPRSFQGFTYIWDQGPVDAVTQRTIRYIHFRFPDRTVLRQAFTYDWRLWSLPELKEIMEDAGFRRSDVYWETFDKDGDGTGIYRKVKKAYHVTSWVAYLVAWP